MYRKVDRARDEALDAGKHLKEVIAAVADEVKDQAQYSTKDMKSAEKTAEDKMAAAKEAKDRVVHKYEDVQQAAERKLIVFGEWIILSFILVRLYVLPVLSSKLFSLL